MNIIFMGTPEFAVPSLKKISEEGHKIVTVVTQPDKPRSRGRKVGMPAVKRVALEMGLPIIQPAKIKSDDFYNRLKELNAECMVVVAFGRILPGRIIFLPPLGSINLHPSLLPLYRGAAPINWAIINGERETGCTTMFMDEGMDTGDILLSERVTIEPEENALELSRRLADIGAHVLCKTLRELEKGNLTAKKQDDSKAIYAPMLKKEDGLIDWSLTAQNIHNRIRGMFPWPGSCAHFRGSILKIIKAGLTEDKERFEKQGKCGEIVSVSKDEMLITCGQKTFLSILQIQPQNRSIISVKEFINGYHPKEGEVFATPGFV
jgi:methionyl-tRNA formyltransferase